MSSTSPPSALVFELTPAPQLRTIIDFRALENARKDNEIMMGLSQQAREDNKIMVALSRMITLLTIIYVPLTFAAVSLPHCPFLTGS